MMNSRNYSKQTRPSRKVISVPSIRFNKKKSSISKNSAAIKIQKVFRSFLVRKSVKKIISIKTEITQIEQRLNEAEFVNIIRNDPKERLRVNETLMSLLLKLDSVRGIYSSVRNLRKTVTRKTISLQEKVDSIASEQVTKTVKEDNGELKSCFEKLMDDNEKMMKLMMQISERNEMQTETLNSLSRRVEDLEKGSMNDKLKKEERIHGGFKRVKDDFYI